MFDCIGDTIKFQGDSGDIFYGFICGKTSGYSYRIYTSSGKKNAFMPNKTRNVRTILTERI